MSNDVQPKIVKAKITRTVTEIAIVKLDRNGNIEEVRDIHEEQEEHSVILETVISVIDVY